LPRRSSQAKPGKSLIAYHHILVSPMNPLPDERTKRFVAILNKKVEMGKLLNALGHMTAGLAGASLKHEDMCFLRYEDADGGVHPHISHYPFIVLSADNGNQIRTFREEVIRRALPFVDFTSSMVVGTSQEQLDKTKVTPEKDLEYYGITVFGDANILKEMTKKFSLFR